MSQNNAPSNESVNAQNQQEDLEESPTQTPLQQIKEQQAISQQNLQVAQQREDPSPEVPGQSNPSNRRKHPQRQMYGSGTDES